MFARHVAAGVLLLALAACAVNGPRMITPGVIETGKLRVTLGEDWYRVPGSEAPEIRSASRALTREGPDTDRLYLVAGIDSGDTLFRESHAGGARPFSADMAMTNIPGFIADSLQATLWGGSASIEAIAIEERGFTRHPGCPVRTRSGRAREPSRYCRRIRLRRASLHRHLPGRVARCFRAQPGDRPGRHRQRDSDDQDDSS